MFKISLRLWRFALTLCLISVMVLALMPDPPNILSPVGIKANHLLAFAVITFTGNYSFPQKRLQVVLGSLAFGALIEATQLLTTYRDGQFSDLGVDAGGITIGLALVLLSDVLMPAPSVAKKEV